MADTGDLIALHKAALSVQDMRAALAEGAAGPSADAAAHIVTTEMREEGFYWVILGQTRRRSPIGSAASGGGRAMPGRGSRKG